MLHFSFPKILFSLELISCKTKSTRVYNGSRPGNGSLPGKNISTTAFFWPKNILRYLAMNIICFKKPATVFRGHSLRKTVSLEGQIMSKDK